MLFKMGITNTFCPFSAGETHTRATFVSFQHLLPIPSIANTMPSSQYAFTVLNMPLPTLAPSSSLIHHQFRLPLFLGVVSFIFIFSCNIHVIECKGMSFIGAWKSLKYVVYR